MQDLISRRIVDVKILLVFLFILFAFYIGHAESAVWPDTSFNGTGVFVDDFPFSVTIEDLSLDKQGRYVMAGWTLVNNNVNEMIVLRLNADGTLDASFNGKGYATHRGVAIPGTGAYGHGVAIDSKGRIIIAGHTQPAASVEDITVWRYNSDGSLDLSFGGSGFVTSNVGNNDRAHAVAVDNINRIVVAGESSGVAVWRFNENGTLDTTFNNGSGYFAMSRAGYSDYAEALKIDSSGRILLAGHSKVSSTIYGLTIWRLNNNGTLDTTFSDAGIAFSPGVKAYSMTFDNNENILVASDRVLRFNTNGNLDASFNNDTGYSLLNCCQNYTYGHGIAIDGAGNIIVAGQGGIFNGQLFVRYDMFMWRFNPDGTPDSSFNSGSEYVNGGPGLGKTVALDETERVIVAGRTDNFSNYDPVAPLGRMKVWRYNTSQGPPSPNAFITDSDNPSDDRIISYGMVTAGASSLHTVNVANNGLGVLELGTVGTNPGQEPFIIDSDDCSNQFLNPEESCSIQIRFAPASPGSFTAMLDIPSNDPGESVVSVSLSGEGTLAAVPDISITDTLFPPNDLKLPFYSVTEGTSSETYSISISNTGEGILSISTIQLTGDDAADFTADLSQPVLDCLAAINSATTCSIDVTFTPQTPGGKVASLAMTTNDPDEATVSVLLSGIGAPEEANVPPKRPQLLFPGNGNHGLGTSLQLKWNQTTDPDGDPVTYHIYISESPSFASSLEIQTASSAGASVITFAESSLGLFVFGVIVVGGVHQRRKIALVLVFLILMGTLILSCGSSSDNSSNQDPSVPTVVGLTANSLKNNTTYYWKVRADDGKGGIADSETWLFTVSE